MTFGFINMSELNEACTCSFYLTGNLDARNGRMVSSSRVATPPHPPTYHKSETLRAASGHRHIQYNRSITLLFFYSTQVKKEACHSIPGSSSPSVCVPKSFSPSSSHLLSLLVNSVQLDDLVLTEAHSLLSPYPVGLFPLSLADPPLLIRRSFLGLGV